MSERLQSKEELLGLLGNCLLALALAKEEQGEILIQARMAADRHVEELNKRFPEWKEELHALSAHNEQLKL